MIHGDAGNDIALIHSRTALSEVAQKCIFVAVDALSADELQPSSGLDLGFLKITAGLHRQAKLCQTVKQ